jgi:hypothetical protein
MQALSKMASFLIHRDCILDEARQQQTAAAPEKAAPSKKKAAPGRKRARK